MFGDRFRLWVLVAGLLAFAWSVVGFWRYTVDDAFIIFRYSENLASGHGPVFNAVGERAEGVTQVLWMGLLALPVLAGVDVVTTAKVVGTASTSLLLAVLAVAARRPGDGGRDDGRLATVLTALFAVPFVATFPPTAVHSVSGLETALFTLQVTVHLLLCTHAVATPTARTIALPISALLLGVARPDGNLLAVLSLLGVLLCTRSRTLARSTLLLYVLPGAVYFVVRQAYYGHALPLPIYVKLLVQPELDDPTVSGTYQAWDFLRTFGPTLVLPFALGLAAPRRTAIPAALAVVGFLGACLVPAHIMGFEWRYFFPVLPLLALVAGRGVFRLHCVVTRAIGPRTAVVAAVLCCAAPIAVNLAERGPRRADLLAYADGLSRAHVALGKRLAAFPGEPGLLVVGDAGAVPFFSRWQTYDIYGLNEPSIATTGCRDAAAILARKPDVLVLISSDHERFDPRLPWEAALHAAAVRAGLVRTNRLAFSDSYFLWVLAQPDSPVFRWLAAWDVGR